MILSFGFTKGIPQADRIFDARGLKNPYGLPRFAGLDGRDETVQAYVLDAFGRELVDDVCQTLAGLRVEHDRDWVLAVGCVGGKHRSVAVAEAVGKKMGEMVYHRELQEASCELCGEPAGDGNSLCPACKEAR